MDLNEIAVFIKVVQIGSFSGAARALSMPNSTVSSKISSLETRLGTTLLKRTTRKLSVTAEGDELFKRALIGLEQITAAEAELVSHRSEAHGLLRLTAPVELGSTLLPTLIAEFIARFPLVNIEVILTDRRVDLLGENIDLAIRAGVLKDSSLIAKGLGSVYFAPFASPKYLKAKGNPQHPKDLRNHEIIHFAPLARDFKLGNGRSLFTIQNPIRLNINDLNMVKQLAVAGSGIAMFPTFYCGPELKSGKLVRILPDWHSDLNPVHFVYPAQKHVTKALSEFVSFATEPIRKSLQIL
jgi:DNA-binding transcriptional LysR family regulator